MTVEVFDSLASSQGLQKSGWFAKIVKDKFNIKLNIIAPNVSGGDTVFGSSTAARMLQDNAAALTGNPAEAQRLVIQAWSLVHGLAMLMLDGQLPADDALIDRVIDARVLLAG